MIVVIQCAASKSPMAGHLRRQDGKKVFFVADPEKAPANSNYVYARPDDMSDTGKSWREELLRYNARLGDNPLGLLPAWQLYENRTYSQLKDHFGLKRLYILSAGWGLIAADFLTPNYDITFSTSADAYKRRRKKDRYDDLRMQPEDNEEPIVFLGGKSYVKLFYELSNAAKGRRCLFYNSAVPPDAPGCILKRFRTRTRTNWHYQCAQALIRGDIKP
jgi:hypothetical protein